MDHRARHLEGNRLLHAHAPDLELDARAGRATQLAHCLVVLPPFGRAPIQHDDAVPGQHAGALGGHIRQGRHDRDPAVAHVDLDAQAAVLPGGLLGERVEVIGLQVHGVGVVELVEEAVDRHLIEPALVDRVHVEVRDAREHVVEQAGRLVHRPRGGRAALQQPPARGQRQHRGDDDEHDPLPLHDVPPTRSCSAAALTVRHAASCTAVLDPVASMCTTPGPAARRYASSTRR